MITLVRELCRIHLFKDANNRTFINCLLNELLIKHGFPFVIPFDPNVFELHTVPQLIEFLKQWMEVTKNLINFPAKEVYGFKSDDIPLLDKQKYTHYGQLFLQKIAMKANKLGSAAFERGAYQEAAKDFALAHRLQINSIAEGKAVDKVTATYLENLARAALKLGDLQKARQNFHAAFSLFNRHQLGDKVKEVGILIQEVDELLRKQLERGAADTDTMSVTEPRIPAVAII